jgi:antitoxin component of MazEF toxin-antitoxin module
MIVEVTAKKWGNSFGVIVPRRIVEELDLREGTKFMAEFRKPKKTVLEELAEAAPLKDVATSTADLLKETREGFSKWM